MFREFKVGELFETLPYRGGLQVLTGGNVSSKYLLPGNTPRISVTSQNNGIIGYYEDVDIKSYRVFENAISVSFLGTVFYHPYRASYDMKVHCLRLKDHELRECEALYLVSVLKKLVSIYNYSNQVSSTEIVDLSLCLPVKPGTDEVNYTEDDIDWAYMESYIHELEQSYIHELEQSYIHELDAYLKETGLDDYTLTDDEREVLEREPVFKEFEVGELFDVHPTKAYKFNNSGLLSRAGSTPVVVNSSQNNGIGGYSELEPTEAPGILTFSDTTTGQNTLFYQNQPFIGYSHVQGMYPKNFKFNNLTALFMVATLRATLGKRKWDYSNKLNRAIVIETQIQLPVKQGTDDVDYTEADIDWVYMDAYVRVMEKLVIADVVDYKNEMIATTKGLIKN